MPDDPQLPFAAVRAALAWQLVAARARLRGVDPRELRRVHQMIRAGAGVAPAQHAARLQTPRAYMRGLAARPWHAAADFESAAKMRAALDDVAADARRAYERGLFVPKQPDRIAEGAWSTLYLSYLGHPLERACTACPQAAALIATLADASALGLHYFCALEPGSRLVPHVGHTNTKLRIQLNLDVPEGCALRVGEEERPYRNGECLVIDESFENTDRNYGDRVRLALMVDVWHPDLTRAEVDALDAMTRLSFAASRRRRAAVEAMRAGAWR